MWLRIHIPVCVCVSEVFCVVNWSVIELQPVFMKSSTITLKVEKQSFMVMISRTNKGVFTQVNVQGIRERPESQIKTKQQWLLPYFFVTHEFNCLFGESAYVKYALPCLREIRVENSFQHKHKHFDRMKTWEVFSPRSHKSTPLCPAARTLKEIKHLSFLSFTTAKLGIFERFFILFFLVRSGIPLPQPSSIYGIFQLVSCWRLGDGSVEYEAPCFF